MKHGFIKEMTIGNGFHGFHCNVLLIVLDFTGSFNLHAYNEVCACVLACAEAV